MEIYKYPLKWKEHQTIEVPTIGIENALTIQVQNGVPCLWVIVDDECVKRNSMYHIDVDMVGTGAKFDMGEKLYISTTQYNGYVFHWFVEWRT